MPAQRRRKMYQVKVLRPGYAYWQGPAKQKANGTITLIKGRKLVLVDTGSPWDKELLLALLEKEGISPHEVDYLICTHGHSDHIGNNNLFQNAIHIVSYDISKQDYYSFHNFSSGQPYIIDEDLKIIPTPGHTSEDISVIVKTPEGVVGIVGDLFENKDDIEHPELWQAFSKDIQTQERNRQKILELVDFIVPGHGDIFSTPKLLPTRKREENREIEVFLRRHEGVISYLATEFQTHLVRPDEEKIKEWLRQFGSVEKMKLALKLLRHIEYFDDARIQDVFQELYSQYLESYSPKLAFTLLGRLQESTSRIIYLCSKALESKGKFIFDELRNIVRKRDPKETILVFVDDIIASGGQALDIFSDWLNLPSQPKKEERMVDALSSKEIKWLRETEIAFLTIYGFQEGISALEELLTKEGLKVNFYPAILTEEEFGCFQARSGIFNDERERLKAMEMAQEIGYELFADKEWPEKLRWERALGYGNSQKLIVFSYNTPTCTLPIFWKKGEYQGKSWMPLFPRQDQ